MGRCGSQCKYRPGA